MSDKGKEFVCTLCGEIWKTLPENAIQLTNFGGRGRTNTYKFSDGTVHVIKVCRTKETK